MLELKDYTKPDLSAVFGTKGMEGLQRKMRGYGIVFDVYGRGESAIFTIKEITDPFKVYCITELGFDGRTDFKKLLYFLYYFLNDDEFRAMPDEVKEVRMEERDKRISRQTIANYTAKLDALDLIDRNTYDFVYYFAFKHTQRFVEKKEYSQAWREHWERRTNGMGNYESIARMIVDFGGVARKQPKPEFNDIYIEQIKYLNTLVQQNIEKEIETQN